MLSNHFLLLTLLNYPRFQSFTFSWVHINWLNNITLYFRLHLILCYFKSNLVSTHKNFKFKKFDKISLQKLKDIFMVSIHLSLTILSKSLCPQDTATHSLQFQPSNSFSYYIIFFLEKLLLTQLQKRTVATFCTGKASWAIYHLSNNIYFFFFSVCHFYASYCASSMHMNSMIIYFERFSYLHTTEIKHNAKMLIKIYMIVK